MKIKTSKLIGAALDWAVAKINYPESIVISTTIFPGLACPPYVSVGERDEYGDIPYAPSTDWEQGGPIIEKEELELRSTPGSEEYWCYSGNSSGPTPLVAAMRCYVTSNLGDEVDILDELLPS